MKAWFLLAAFLFMFAGFSSAEELRFSSGPQGTALLELYTSEGCSSCPPAEARLSRLKNDPGLWNRFVPVAYHVDYWDRLGWRDRFSAKEFTDRQSRYAALWRSESIYTPAFVLNGRELRGGPENLAAAGPAPGRLSAVSSDGRTWSIEFRPAKQDEAGWDAHVALLGAGMSTKVGAGENSGRNLLHDFVVLSQRDVSLKKAGDQAAGSLTINPSSENVPQKALAVWVTHRGQLPPVQATGGWLPR